MRKAPIPQIDWMAFAIALIHTRERLGSKKKITKLIGVSRWTLYRAECGDRVCVQNYLAICALMEISPYWFYHGKKPSTSGNGHRRLS